MAVNGTVADATLVVVDPLHELLATKYASQAGGQDLHKLEFYSGELQIVSIEAG